MKYNILVISFLILIISCSCVDASWWDNSYNFRKNITLTGNTSGVQTDYQLLLNVTYDSDMQSDFDDLRFCNETHKLNSWLESKVDDSYALVWVEFPTTPANGVNQTYYMYYGNVGAVNDWDGDATFLFFEGWDNLNAWTIQAGSPSVSGGELTLNNDALFHDIVFPSLFSVRARIKYSDNTKAGGRFVLLEDAWCLVWETGPHIGWTSTADIKAYYGAWYDGGDYASGVYDIIEMRDVDNTAHTFDLMVNDIAGISGASFRNDKTMGMIGLAETDNAADFISDWLLVRKYAANLPMYSFGSEEGQLKIPPRPINLVYLSGNFWINHTWAPGTGNVTDSYNVSINDVWHNTSPSYYNDTYTAHAWQNITVWAYNLSSTGTLSLESISQDTQIPNNPIAITNTSDWTGDAGEIVYVDYDAIDIDSDIATFSCNRTDLFIDFDTVTGKGNWTSTANIYYVNFGVSDGYGSTSNYTMTLRELSVTVTPLLDEVKLIMSEITTGLSDINMSNYLVYAFILIGILLIILVIQIIGNGIYRG